MSSISYIISARAIDEFALGTQDRVVARGEEVKCTANTSGTVGRERACGRERSVVTRSRSELLRARKYLLA